VIAFWIAGTLAVVFALTTVLVPKAVYGALSLAAVMICLAILYITLDAPFLAVVQVIVYTGAVMMLFLFVLMLVGVDSSDSLVETIRGQRLFAIPLAVVFAALLLTAVGRASLPDPAGLDAANASGNVQGLAALLFSDYVLGVELVSGVLIVAALGATVLAHRERLGEKVTQRSEAERRLQRFATAGVHPGPLPPPGTFARHNAVDTPALLPDGRTAPNSVSRLLVARGDVLEIPETATDVEAMPAVLRDATVGSRTQSAQENQQMGDPANGMRTRTRPGQTTRRQETGHPVDPASTPAGAKGPMENALEADAASQGDAASRGDAVPRNDDADRGART